MMRRKTTGVYEDLAASALRRRYLPAGYSIGFAQGVATGDLRVIVKDPKGSVVTNARSP